MSKYLQSIENSEKILLSSEVGPCKKAWKRRANFTWWRKMTKMEWEKSVRARMWVKNTR
jgi:hypothetical protein